MTKILVISDDGVSSGYGRISMEINTRLVKRGYTVQAFGLYYDGLLPPTLEGAPLNYWVSAGSGKPDWVQAASAVINVFQPDIVHVKQDATYAEALRNAPIDWSRHAFVVTTPVDGAPVYPPWVKMLKEADGTLSISQFGVDTHRAAGIPSELCRPGVDSNVFFPMNEAERRAMRARMNIAPDAFVVGTMAQNQGRKDIPDMLRGFFAFAADKPSARYLLDMDAHSPMGWDIPALCVQQGWDAGKLLFRADAQRAGILTMRARYNLLDAHMVISHREGYGLPLVEAMACGVVSMALDYTSGTEVCGGGKGVLIAPIDYTNLSTWGGAVDKFPNVTQLAASLQMLYDEPDTRQSIARKGMAWARAQTWDAATDAVARVYERVMAKRPQTGQPALMPDMVPPSMPVAQPDGMVRDVALVEGVS